MRGKGDGTGYRLVQIVDHPRVCGEKRFRLQSFSSARGSPPRMRGKGLITRTNGAPVRITPAYAGKRVSGYPGQDSTVNHPRVCGEKITHPSKRNASQGSPPRMRGKEQEEKSTLERVRITPAYAGKSDFVCKAFHPPEDHPRVCGEKSFSGLPVSGRVGITPAYAGKSFCRRGISSAPMDHPRVCGEKPHSFAYDAVPLGSPPRMRGKGLMEKKQMYIMRITPAYAGKSTGTATDEETFGDHPRVCGEKHYFFPPLVARLGSPPRMRGKVQGCPS